MDLFQHALQYLSHGFSIIPILGNGSKKPPIKWAQYQRRLPTKAEITQWFEHQKYAGLAAVCGKVSGGLEVIDVDCEHLQSLMVNYLIDHNLQTSVAIIKTPRPGLQIWYRCDAIEGSQKLAYDSVGKCLVETRGEKGYVLAVGCQAAAHPSGRHYEVRDEGVSPWLCQRLSPETRSELIEFCVDLSEQDMVTTAPDCDPAPNSNPDLPGNHYARETSWSSILVPAGWKEDGFGRVKCQQTNRSRRVTNWCRPGKDEGVSATTGLLSQHGNEVFYNFSTSVDIPTHKPFTKFGLFTHLHCGGDHAAAAETLRMLGYGIPITESSPADDFDDVEISEHEPPLVTKKPEPLTLSVPGFVDRFAAYINDTSHSLQPNIAVASALGALSTLIGTSIQWGWTAPNIYLTILSKTGTGKSRPQAAVRSLFKALDQPLRVIDSDINSPNGVAKALRQVDGRGLLQIDEFGFMLAALVSNKANENALKLKKFFLTSFSEPGKTFATAYANDKLNFTVESTVFSIVGYSTPSSLHRAIDSGDVNDGFLTRMLFIEGLLEPEEGPERRYDIPDDIVRTAREISLWSEFNEREYLKASSAADEVLRRFKTKARNIIREANATGEDRPEAAWWTRATEHVAKLTILAAVSKNPGAPKIDAGMVEWAVQTVESCLETGMKFVADAPVNAFHAQQQDLLGKIPHKWVTLSLLTAKTQGLRAKERNELLIALESIGKIETRRVEAKSGKGGRPTIQVRRAKD